MRLFAFGVSMKVLRSIVAGFVGVVRRKLVVKELMIRIFLFGDVRMGDRIDMRMLVSVFSCVFVC
jgi:hypothetical protein